MQEAAVAAKLRQERREKQLLFVGGSGGVAAILGLLFWGLSTADQACKRRDLLRKRQARLD